MTRTLSVLLACGAWAQNSEIQGLITESAGAAVPGVAVQITNVETGVVTQSFPDAAAVIVASSWHKGQVRPNQPNQTSS